VPNSVITGDIGVSPIASTAITGMALALDPSGQFSTSTQFTGKAFAASYAAPTPGTLTIAVGDMQTAYKAAAERPNKNAATRTNIKGGAIGGETFFPGVYTFTGVGISIASDITFEGGLNDVFIIQGTAGLTQAGGTHVNLSGCAQAKNIFWQLASDVAIAGGASMKGIILTATKATFADGASLEGSVLAQTAVTLVKNTITQADDTCNTR
jgi:hypothetical protein